MKMNRFTSISHGVQKVIGDIIGPENIIDMRRKIMNSNRDVQNIIQMFDYYTEEIIYSGSRGEGFRFTSSDEDYMLVRRGIRAIFDPSQRFVGASLQAILLAETDQTKPGFALLRLIHQSGLENQVMESLVKYGSGCYLSSTLWVRSGIFVGILHNSFIHGPCISATLGIRDVDFAECIKSNTLPTNAYKNIQRLHESGHLPYNELKSICLQGCHFVAIGSKRPLHETLEWRISFSLAEKAIIHSFNHTQFLCYGLLKIFLKEAIETNAETKDLLCSYFMKTTIFWLLLDGNLLWTPDNLLLCFRKCFQLLMDWVVNEYCPNFFIPENNMFADKFTREQHTRLLSHLSSLYHEESQSILRCSSINDKVYLIKQGPNIRGGILSRRDIPSKSYDECTLINEIWNKKPDKPYNDIKVVIIHYLDQLRCDNPYQMICTAIWKCMFLTEIALKTGPQFQTTGLNTTSLHYRQFKEAITILKTCEIDALSNLLYYATYLYRLESFSGVLRVIQEAKIRLQHPYIIYPWDLDNKKYAAAGGETRHVLDLMREIVAFPVCLHIDTCIPELYLEIQHVDGHSEPTFIVIPPLVYAVFLDYLCHFRLGNFDNAALILQKYKNFLYNGTGHHIHDVNLAISWEILGICQEMIGDYFGALCSYRTATNQAWCPINAAAEIRLTNVLPQLF